MALSRRSSFRRTGVRHRSSWEIGLCNSTDGAPITISASSAVAVPVAASAGVDGLTVIRIRGELNVYLTSSGALGNGFVGAFGIGKATDAAILSGIASVPTPLTEDSWDGWLYHRYF